MKKEINLRLFSDLETIMSGNADAFKDSPDFKTNFDAMSNTLKSLGYDILINNSSASEFVPISRMNDVVAAREQYKNQINILNQTLEKMQNEKGLSEQSQAQLNKLIQDNKALNEKVLDMTTNMEIIINASDAINPNDVLAFVDKTKLKQEANGTISGVKEEIARIRSEKPYLFNAQQQHQERQQSGTDNSQFKNNGGDKLSMNALIRRSAGFSV